MESKADAGACTSWRRLSGKEGHWEPGTNEQKGRLKLCDHSINVSFQHRYAHYY